MHRTLAHIILEARQSKGYTQEDLADISQLTVRTIQRVENGETIPRAYTLKTLATALEIPFETLQAAIKEDRSKDTVPLELAEPLEEQHILHIICLSCFSYLIIPIIHFLIPVYILYRQKKHLTPAAIRKAQQLIRQQVFWVASTHLLLLITFFYNYLNAVVYNSKHLIHYLVPLAIMYLFNAFLLGRTLSRQRKHGVENQ